MPTPTLHTFTSQRLNLSYAEWGNPDAPPLMLVHGGRDQKRSWDWVASHLSDRYHVFAHDLRGHGQSEWVTDGDYGVMDHVFDLAGLIDHVSDGPVTIVGHSLGGNISLRYTGLFPERVAQLVAIEGLGPSPKMLAEREAEAFDDRLRNWIDQRRDLSDRTSRIMANATEAEARMRNAFSHLSEEQIKHLTRTGLRHNDDGTVSWAYDPAGLGRSPSDIPHDHFQALWKKITCPTWLVYGRDSWASDPSKDGRAENFQNATVSIIEKAGHWLHHDQFDDFIAQLNGFLSTNG